MIPAGSGFGYSQTGITSLSQVIDGGMGTCPTNPGDVFCVFLGTQNYLRQDFWEHDTFKKDLGIDGIVINKWIFGPGLFGDG